MEAAERRIACPKEKAVLPGQKCVDRRSKFELMGRSTRSGPGIRLHRTQARNLLDPRGLVALENGTRTRRCVADFGAMSRERRGLGEGAHVPTTTEPGMGKRDGIVGGEACGCGREVATVVPE